MVIYTLYFSKTVADLKVRFPSLQEGMKGLLSSEMEMVVRAEKFLKEEPERLESALKRCKKLTSTLVTLKRYVRFSSSLPDSMENEFTVVRFKNVRTRVC